MASCGGFLKQHQLWLYGRGFCVECSLQAVAVDPEAMLAPLLTKLQMHPLRMACAVRTIHALLEVAKPSTFPLHLIPAIVKALEAVLSKLQGEGSSDACSALLTKCLDIMINGTGPQIYLAGCIISECLVSNERRLARLHAAHPGRLPELLGCARVPLKQRKALLKQMQSNCQPTHLLDIFIGLLQKADDAENAAAVLEIMNQLLLYLPDEEDCTESLVAHLPRLFSKLARCIVSREHKLKLVAANMLLGLLNMEKAEIFTSFFKTDACDAVCEAMMGRDSSVTMHLLECVLRLCETEQFFKQNRGNQFVKSIGLNLSVVCVKTNWQTYLAGLKVLGAIFTKSLKFGCDSVKSDSNLIYQVLKIGLESNLFELEKVAANTSVSFLAAKQLSPMEWSFELLPFVNFIESKGAHIRLQKTVCSCFVLKLANALVCWCSSDDEKSSAELQKWIGDTIIAHARDCGLIRDHYKSEVSGKLLTVLELIFSCKHWHGKFILAEELASLNFLSCVYNMWRLSEPSKEAVFGVFDILCREKLNKVFTFDTFQACAVLIRKDRLTEIFCEAELLDVFLALMYLDTLYFNSLKVEQMRPKLVPFLSREFACHQTKWIIFIFAGSKDCNANVPDWVCLLMNQWAALPSKIYTDHPIFVNWALQLQHSQVLQEVQDSILSLWLTENPTCGKVCCSPDTLRTFLNVMVESRNLETSKAAFQAIKTAAQNITEANLADLLWQSMPLYLMRSSSQDADGHFGHALLLTLAAQLGPSRPEAVPVEALGSVLPDIFTRHSHCSDEWSQNIIESSLSIIEIVVVTIHGHRKYKEEELAAFMESSDILLTIEMFLKKTPVTVATLWSLRVATALLISEIQFKPKVLVAHSIEASPRLLLTGIECSPAHNNCQENILVINFVMAAIEISKTECKPLATIGDRHQRPGFAAQYFQKLLVLIGQHPNSTIEAAGWKCLKAVLEWGENDFLCHAPWTHTLIWTKQLDEQDSGCVREMLIFLDCLFKRLRISHCSQGSDKCQPEGSELRMTNRTVQHLLAFASRVAFGLGCKKELGDVLSSALAMDYELQFSVKAALASQLLEFHFSA